MNEFYQISTTSSKGEFGALIKLDLNLKFYSSLNDDDLE